MATVDAFEERYAQLNPEQKRAVDTLDGPVMVVAGPGTGKTEVLTMRIANILRLGRRNDGAGTSHDGKGAAPERILALTFTESGVAAMRRRLAELVGQEAYRVEISTFHGFANRVIREYLDYFPALAGAAAITEIEQVDILRRVIDALPLKDLRPFGDRYYHLRAILAAIGEMKQQGVAPDAFAAIAADAKKDFYANPDLTNLSGKFEGQMKGKYVSEKNRVERNIELAAVYAEYQKALRAAHQYDYSDMIMEVALALERDAELRQVLEDAYDYILVDEHQDTNDAQNHVVELIAGGAASRGHGRPNLFVVGDEHQAIYRFQGASAENFHYFRERYPDVALITLRENYRSTQAVLDTAHAVSPREVPLVAKAGHKEAPVHLAALSSPDAEYYFIAKKIRELIAAGTSAEEIAVLYRNNKDAAPIARMFEKERVPFSIESNQDVLGDEEIRKFVRILRAVQHFGNDVRLGEALHVDFLGIPPIDVYRLSAFAAREHRKMYEVMQYPAGLEAAGVSETAQAAYARLFDHLSKWKRAAKNKGAAEAFEMIAYESGFVAALLKNPSATEKLAKLHALFDILKSSVEQHKNYTLGDFFAYLDLMEEHDLAIRGKDMARLPGRVRLMTAHGAKGLEFDYVFIADVVDHKWGAKKLREPIALPTKVYRGLKEAAEDGGGNSGEGDAAVHAADARNVFYVALTRARKELFFTMAMRDHDGREQLAAQFITAIRNGDKKAALDEYDIAACEKDFAARREEVEFTPAPAKVPELEDREFLNGLFRAQGLSVTALNNYLECPWAYFYRNLVRIPEAPNKHLSFGNAVHAALKHYFDAFSKGQINDKSGEAYLVNRFEEAIAREPITESEYKEALAKGRRAFTVFYVTYHGSWSRRALAEVRIDGVTLSDGTAINGKLDRIEFLDDGDKRVRVIDYKTGKPKSRNEIEGNTKGSDGDYKRQLVFYKMLLDKEGKREMADGVIQFIEPDDRGKMHCEEFIIAAGETTTLEAQVMQVAHEILDLSFWNKGCHEPDCRYCELRKGMG